MEENKILEQFKSAILNSDVSEKDLVEFAEWEGVDQSLLRFLKARDYNISKATEMLKNNIEFRHDNEIASILHWTPSQFLSENYPYEITGTDRDGCPVLVVPFGEWDVRAVCEKGLKDDYIRYVDQLFAKVLDKMRQQSESLAQTQTNQDQEDIGKVSQFVLIFVPDNLSAFRQMASHQAVDAVLETVRRFEANHPERLKKAFCVDTPKVFQVIYSVIRPMVNARTLGKVVIAGGSREWLPLLQDLIPDPSSLPPRLGGTHLSISPTLRKERIKNPTNSLGNLSSSFFTKNIAAGKKLCIEYHVPEGRTFLSWAFKTDKFDIGFSILFESETVVPYSRLNSHENLQTGSFFCKLPGKYTLIFDNTFSRWRAKKVKYRVMLRDREDDDSDGNQASDTEQLEHFTQFEETLSL